jgi:hypothetical protein
MLKKQCVPMALSSLLLASPLLLAEDAHHPQQSPGTVGQNAAVVGKSTEATGSTAAGTSQMMGSGTMSQGMMGSQQGKKTPTPAGTMGPGMMMKGHGGAMMMGHGMGQGSGMGMMGGTQPTETAPKK